MREPRTPIQLLGIGQLVGALGLTIVALAQLPPLTLRPPATPYDRSDPELAPLFSFLQRASAVVPIGASVTVQSAAGDPRADSRLHRLGVALLPERRVSPQALWDVPLPPTDTEYVIVVGRPPPAALGAVVLEEAGGSVWRRPASGNR